MTTLATLDRVTRLYGNHAALSDVSLSISSGSILGMLGPNGAGKTTVLSLLQGLRRPSSGTVTLFGGNPRDSASREKLGSTPQETALPASLRVRECLTLVAKHYPRPYTLDEISGRFGLNDLLHKQTGALSGGQRRRVSVALAFVGRPQLVLLDEPTTGLDVDGRHLLWSAVRELHAEGTTVVVTSHYLEEIEALAERVAVVNDGRVIAEDTLGRVLGRVSQHRVEIDGVTPNALAGLEGIAHVEAGTGDGLTLLTPNSDRLIRDLVDHNIPFRNLRVRGATLEEAFLALTDNRGERS